MTPLGLWRRLRVARLRSRLERTNTLDPTCRIELGAILERCRVGRHAQVNARSDLTDTTIGAFSQIAEGVVVAPRNHIHSNFTVHDFLYEHGAREHLFPEGIWEGRFRAKIGNDVWIGQGAIVLHGVEIGDGAVVAAGAVVSRSVPPYAIVAGNPARKVSERFPPEVRERLQQTRWWDWPMERILAERQALETLVGFEFPAWKARHLLPRPPLP